MFNPTEVMIDAFVKCVSETYRNNYGNSCVEEVGVLGWVARMALENIANSDALYHDVEHTMLVTIVGQEILRGKHIAEGGVTRRDWLQFMISLVCHDIGYVRGVCRQDRDGIYATGIEDQVVEVPHVLTDASLTPYHVDRGKLFIKERFSGNAFIDVDDIQRNIELTRFPVPESVDQVSTTCYPGLVRASDLIGQLSDPRYLQKTNRLFGEFEETGVNAKLGYKNPEDLRVDYPKFYWDKVFPFVKEALSFLNRTQQGKTITAHLYANVFRMEHHQQLLEAQVASAQG